MNKEQHFILPLDKVGLNDINIAGGKNASPEWKAAMHWQKLFSGR